VPELASLPTKWIHQPWNAPSEILRQAGIILGKTYPNPLVNHESARREALLAFDSIKK
jgi:deoxyribodipyrimidine photo-lyase